MKQNILLVFFVFLSGQLFAHDMSINLNSSGLPRLQFEDDYRIYKKHHDIIIENEEETQEVVISKEGDLWVNGDRVRVKRGQRELLVEYHDLATKILRRGEEVGEEGVKVGLQGAVLGVKAVSGVFKILLPGYTAQDFGEEMEEAAGDIEKKAKKLDDKADALDVMGEYLQDIHRELRCEIEELQALGWF